MHRERGRNQFNSRGHTDTSKHTHTHRKGALLTNQNQGVDPDISFAQRVDDDQFLMLDDIPVATNIDINEQSVSKVTMNTPSLYTNVSYPLYWMHSHLFAPLLPTSLSLPYRGPLPPSYLSWTMKRLTVLLYTGRWGSWNSRVGGAVQYSLSHWYKFTVYCTHHCVSSKEGELIGNKMDFKVRVLLFHFVHF